MNHIVSITSIKKVTHDVLSIVTEKPKHFIFTPGQATEVSINHLDWRNLMRPFTFTCLPKDNYIEFTIKTYPLHNNVTKQLMQIKEGDELILHKVFGTINYKGEGAFIAGGAGITPFISILRDLYSKNEIGNNLLIFANKTKADIIYEQEFKKMLGKSLINILSDEEITGYANGLITEDFLKSKIDNIDQYFYLCGPPQMMDSIEKQLTNLKVDKAQIIKEVF